MLSINDIIESELARRSILNMGRTWPNPTVAAVVSSEDPPLLFSGATEEAGKRHAEIVALDSLESEMTFDRRGRSSYFGIQSPSFKLYVTLEPCSSYGRTPPCTARILKNPDVQEVIVDAMDPDMAGKIRLEQGGRIFRTTDHSSTAYDHSAFLKGFLQRNARKRPRYHLKAAVTRDGFMGHRNVRWLISGPSGRIYGMLLRSRMDGVIVGAGTVATDLPSLNLRIPEGYFYPVRMQDKTGPHYMPVYWKDLWRRGTSLPFFSDLLHISCGEAKDNANALWREKEFEEKKMRGCYEIRMDTTMGIFYDQERMLDPISHSILRFSRDIWMDMHSVSRNGPLRIFLMDRPFRRESEFLQKQGEITTRTGAEPLYLVHHRSQDHWNTRLKNFVVVPDLKDSGFAVELGALLSHRGCNEVLVEGGAALFNALERELKAGDRIDILRSNQDSSQWSNGDQRNRVEVPFFLMEGRKISDYSLGSDRLEVYRPGSGEA